MSPEAHIVRLSAWAPGIESPEEWKEWALGKRAIVHGAKGPEITFTDPIFRRRLSQISKMTIQVTRDLMPAGFCSDVSRAENTKIFFLSFRGELSRQFQINKTLIQEKTVSPAAFSLSVFNAPVALATIALGLKGGYTALYPGKNSFSTGIKAAEAALVSGDAPAELIFVYADEELPPEYQGFSECSPPAAFGLLLSSTPNPLSIPLSSINKDENNPLAFLRQLLLCGKINTSAFTG